MRVFLTGATGFIGSRILPELLAAGHEVTGLVRSQAGANALQAMGARPYLGALEDTRGLSAGAEDADAVIHTAFDQDFKNFAANCEKDRRVIEALGSVLKGSDRPMLITSAVGMGNAGDGRPASEDVFDRHHANPRVASELAGQALLEAGVNVSVVRLPQVHDTARQGLISPFIDLSREKGVVAYAGEGLNCWSAGHVLDVARLYVLALGRAEPGARYNAVSEEGIAVRDIAKAVAAGLDLPLVSLKPEEVAPHFGWLSIFAAMDLQASSALTRQRLGWTPTGPGLIADLKNMDYSAPAA
jgi:nucleoside-diphosphate-sugar epimerase